MVTANKFFAVTLIIFLRQSKLCVTQETIEVAETTPAPVQTTTVSSVCSSTKTSCLDCLTLQICYPHKDGSFIPVELPCKDESPKTPYCDNNSGTCVTYDESCIQHHFPNCYSEGIIPDPLNCKQYFNCVDKEDTRSTSTYVGITYTCPYGPFAYDHKSKTCRLFQRCLDFTENNLCFNKANKFVVYPPDHSIYVRCPPANLNLYPIIYKCKGSYLYNPEINKCDAVCTKEIKIKDNFSCNKFYECIKDFRGYVRQLRFCPRGQHFIEDKQICEKAFTECEPIDI